MEIARPALMLNLDKARGNYRLFCLPGALPSKAVQDLL
jgi:hypothetical protein